MTFVWERTGKGKGTVLGKTLFPSFDPGRQLVWALCARGWRGRLSGGGRAVHWLAQSKPVRLIVNPSLGRVPVPQYDVAAPYSAISKIPSIDGFLQRRRKLWDPPDPENWKSPTRYA